MDNQTEEFLKETLSATRDSLNNFSEAAKTAFEESLNDQITITKEEFMEKTSDVFADLIPVDMDPREMAKALDVLSHIGAALSKKFFGEVSEHD